MTVAVALATAALWSTSASAAIITASVSGVVQSGVDFGGSFGPTGADLTGQTFLAVFTFDSFLGEITHNDGSMLSGGPPFSTSPGFADITIGSTTVHDAGTGGAIISVAPEWGTVTQLLIANEVGFPSLTFGFARSPLLPYNLYGTFSGDPCVGTYECFGQLQVFPNSLIALTPQYYDLQVTGDINPTGVPEPAAWTLMLTGVGLAGAALRRQRALVRI